MAVGRIFCFNDIIKLSKPIYRCFQWKYLAGWWTRVKLCFRTPLGHYAASDIWEYWISAHWGYNQLDFKHHSIITILIWRSIRSIGPRVKRELVCTKEHKTWETSATALHVMIVGSSHSMKNCRRRSRKATRLKTGLIVPTGLPRWRLSRAGNITWKSQVTERRQLP